MAAEISRLRKSRSAHRNVLLGIIVKTQNLMKEGPGEGQEEDVTAMLKMIRTKEDVVAKINDRILDVIDEDEIEADVEGCATFEEKFNKQLVEIENYVKNKKKEKDGVVVPNRGPQASVEGGSVASPVGKIGVKLQKIVIKKFSGDPVAWQQFQEIFNATVNQNTSLTDIEKFSYLKGYVTGPAEKCIEGLPLTNENYKEALVLLQERFGNPQLIIASHMHNLLKLEKVTLGKGCKGLRNLYDQIEGHVRALKTAGVTSEHYGALLIPIIMEKLPEEIKLEISRKLGTADWKIDPFLKIMKDEIAARESCDFMRSSMHAEDSKEKWPRGNHTTTEALHAGVKVLVCAFCGKDHFHDKCSVVTDLAERKRIVYEKKLCYRCLSAGSHVSRNCSSRSRCYRCKSMGHHTAICSKDEWKKDKNETSEKSKVEKSQATIVNSRTSVLLQTASGIMSDTAEKCSHHIKILFDTGSQRTYLSERIVKKLKLQPYSSREMTVRAFGDVDGKLSVFNEYRFCVRNPNREGNLYLTGFAVKHICSPLSEQKIDVVEKLYPVLKDLELSDVSNGSGEIDLLIGADYYGTIVGGGSKKCSKDGLTAMKTKLGWVLFGPYENKDSTTDLEDVSASIVTATNLIQVTQDVGLEVDDVMLNAEVEKLWNLETVGIVDHEGSWVDKCLANFEFVDGRYQVGLPFKENCRFMEDNYALAERRLKNLKKKLDRNPEMLRKYDDIMKAQLRAGIIERVVTKPVVGEVTYSPHRAVIRDDKETTKVRVVYDLSAKNRGPSLNECLYKGPVLTPLMYDILLRFRLSEIALTADIAQAYLQICVNPADRDFLRFLWYDDVTEDDPEIASFRFTRVIFGAGPSQFLLNGVVKVHVEKYDEEDPEFVLKMKRSFYVDDFTTSVQSYEEALELYEKTKERFLEANFNLRKWRTNHSKLRKEIEMRENETSGCPVAQRVLGIRWEERNDNLIMDFKSTVDEAEVITTTKRNILKLLAGIYDPLGFFQPIMVSLKILFQKICLSKIGWDDVIADELVKIFYCIIDEIRKFELKIPRCYFSADPSDPVEKIELHAFSDGSKDAYGGCIYLKFVTASGNVKVVFVTAKSRVVPASKKLTVPRIELLGNLITSRLVVNVCRAFEADLVISKVFCWTDAKITLAWIKSTDKEFDTFVENRVVEIRKNVGINNWHYVCTDVNPADCITRSSNDITFMWFNGPKFLYQQTVQLESQIDCDTTDSSEYLKEVRKRNSVLLVSEEKTHVISNIIDINRYNDYLKLLRITSYVLRFVNNLKYKRENRSLVLSKYLIAAEINQARKLWIIDNQSSLKGVKFDDLKISLNLQHDEDGLIRSFSRLKNASIPHDAKAPVFINKDHKLAEILVYYAHLKVLHRGVKQTLTELRSMFWLTRGRQFVKRLIYPCTVCKKLNSRAYEYPNISQLPEFRFDESYPFASTGVDYLGPLFCLPVYGKSENLYKAYVVLYTCVTTRAVILNVVSNANADNFLNSFKRFLSRRGCPATMVSDNGSVFVADATQKFASDRGINWKFNLDCAPWFGGVWERLVASVKRCLKKVVGVKKLTFVELQTLISEIELILNNCPIGVDYEDDQEDVLTPNHLIFGRRLETTNDLNSAATNSDGSNRYLIKRKKFIDTMLTHFWNRWRKEYVTSLREYQRISKQKHTASIQTNDVVIIYEDKQPRHLWKIARVINVIPGRDGRVRGAEVKVGKSGAVIRRPVNRLYPIVKAETPVDEVEVREC